jgi:hypothetical protein
MPPAAPGTCLQLVLLTRPVGSSDEMLIVACSLQQQQQQQQQLQGNPSSNGIGSRSRSSNRNRNCRATNQCQLQSSLISLRLVGVAWYDYQSAAPPTAAGLFCFAVYCTAVPFV